MFGIRASWFIAFVVICFGRESYPEKNESGFRQNVPETSFKIQNNSDYLSKIFYRTKGNNTQTDYPIIGIDYLDVLNFQTLQKPNITHGSDFKMKNVTNFVINKCCSWNYYLSSDDLHCVLSDWAVLNESFFDKFKSDEFNYLFYESIPNCENSTVLSMDIVSEMDFDFSKIITMEYCIDKNPSFPDNIIVLTCKNSQIFCKNHTCFRKCCSLGKSYESGGRECQKTDSPFKPEFFNLKTLTLDETLKLSMVGVILGDGCENRGKYKLEPDYGEKSYLGVDGTLYFPLKEDYFTQNEFCLEHVKTYNFSGMFTFLCFPSDPSGSEHIHLILLFVGYTISCVFLFLTFLVYLFSPKIQNLYGKTIMCYIICLLTTYVCLAVVNLNSVEFNDKTCANFGYAILFSFLAAFFWLNIMSFDIWKTFRANRSVERSKKKKAKLRFFWYSIYAWSFPSIITSVCAYINEMPNFPYKSIKPMIGGDHCWFSKKTKGIYVFFVAPTSLIILCNIIFYIQTASKIWKVKSDVNKIEKQKLKRFFINKDQFMINGKLFIVMGITWSLEVISITVPHPIWYITDTANVLHGVFIFAVFVLKKKMLQQVSQTLRLPLQIVRQLTSTTTTSSDLTMRKISSDLKADGRTGAIGNNIICRGNT